MYIERHLSHGSAINKPKRIIIHAMAEWVKQEFGDDYEYAPDYLEAEGLSAHVLVAPDGTLYRCREDGEGAYHARGFNVDSLGIEIMLAGRHDYASFVDGISKPMWCVGPQYAAVVRQVREWKRLYGITDVVRHSDLSPGRKLDPGMGFPWTKFKQDIAKEK